MLYEYRHYDENNVSYSLNAIWYGFVILVRWVIENLFYSDESCVFVLTYYSIDVRDPSQNGNVDGTPSYVISNLGFYGNVKMTGSTVDL
jgi:hypothetical protein